MEFNADGSLKLSGSANQRIQDNSFKMENSRCIKLSKDMTRSYSPKLCTISLDASPQIESNFIERTFGFFSKRVDSTVKLIKLSPSEFQVTIGGEFSRCRDCQLLTSMFKDYLNGNVIEKKGNCTFKGAGSLF